MISLNNTNVTLVSDPTTMNAADQIWLLKNGICSEEDLTNNPNNVFMAGFVKVQTKKYDLQIAGNQVVVNCLSTNDDEQYQCFTDKLKPFFDSQNKFKFTAMGINFKSLLIPETNFYELNKKLLGSKSNKWDKYFDSTDTRYGLFYKTQYKGFTLTFKISPASGKLNNNEEKEAFDVDFNYHCNIVERLESYHDNLKNNWLNLKEHSNKIIESFEIK
jgi:hypothetical protein